MRMKQTISLLLALLLLVMVFTGCGKAGTAASEDASASAALNPARMESPVSDFAYAELEDGSIRIISYLGNESDVVVPAFIDGKPVTKIGRNAFFLNATLVSVDLPDTVTKIEYAAFQKCENLQTVVLSQNIVSIEHKAFEECRKLEKITFPEGLTRIGTKAFYYCMSLQDVFIPKTVTYWGDGAFKDSGIRRLELEEGIETIGRNAFANIWIQELLVPASVKKIEYCAFGGCNHLTSITLQEGLEHVDVFAFGATGIEEIIIPRSVQYFSKYVFSDCEKLQAVRFEGDAPQRDLNKEQRYDLGDVSYTIYYRSGAAGFTSPEWNGRPTQIWSLN